MSWVILTSRPGDLDQTATPHKIITSKDYLTHPSLFRGQAPKIINLSSSYSYQSRGYYASLLGKFARPQGYPFGGNADRPFGAQALRERVART